MIDRHILSQLQDQLSVHGTVQSLTSIPAKDRKSCMVMATMQTPDAARHIQRQFGFATFGYTSLIIPEDWLDLNFPSKT